MLAAHADPRIDVPETTGRRASSPRRRPTAAAWLACMGLAGLVAPGCEAMTDHGNPSAVATTSADRTSAGGTSAGEEGPRDPSANNADVPTRSPLPDGVLPTELWHEGWISLFDGRSLLGWTPGSRADWRVEDGAIVVSSGEKGLLCTQVPFADFRFHVDFLAEPRTNSGIFLRTPVRPTDPKSDCYELNIAPSDNPFPTGSLVGRGRSTADASAGKWRTFDVTVEGPRVRVRLDGADVLDYQDPSPLRAGRIGLQLNEGRVAFRNIRVQPLGLARLFDGRSLDGWKTYADMPSRFTVTDEGWLHVRNGRGQLESAESYADFILRLECRTHARGLNSGVFFRCIPGETMNGYECQIHNAFHDGDRTKPVDQGTGAIFRRAPARVVASDDLEWTGITVIADGPRISVWVNGLLVTDWLDERAPHANPRNGLRLEPGTLMLQGHDETTDVSFRELRIARLPGRGESNAP
ncbi:MAG: DUF1080 domain-containing protein [Planctomycetes bacterium]|nr:DUF1080 domain-containing protein [Planctomycetota bacterium]